MRRRNGNGLVPAFTIFLFGMLALSGCTRAVNPKNAQITLDLKRSSKNRSLASTSQILSDIFINVSASDIGHPIYFHWDGHSCGSSSCSPPPSVDLVVPQGQGRLIQVLVVFQGNGGMSFQYGDVAQDLTSAAQTVGVSTVPIGGATKTANVFGRYLNSSNSGPTGLLTAQFVPPNNRPPMTVMEFPIFGGWFSGMFIMDGASINYSLNGAPIFLNANLASPEFTPSAKVFVADLPAYDRIRTNPLTVESQPAQEIIIGFFGPGASTQAACYNTSLNVPIPNAAQAGTGLNTNPTTFAWYGSAPTAGNAGPLVFSGQNGTPNTASVCANSTNEFVDHLIFYEKNLGNGSDSSAGFRGPWQNIPNTSCTNCGLNFVGVSQSGTNTILNWNFLPGTTDTGGIVGVSAFVRTLAIGQTMNDGSLWGNSGVICSKLPALGFSQFGSDVLTSPGTATQGVMTLNNLPNNSQLILCPYVIANGQRIYPDVGQPVWMNNGGMSNQLNIHLIGSNTSSSRIDGPSIGANAYTLLKSSFLNGFHNFAFEANGRWLQATDITSLEATVDGGLTWVALGSASSATYRGGMVPLAYAPTSLLSAVLGSPSTDSTFQLRVNLTSSAQSLYGLSSSAFSTGALTLLGSTTCSAPSLQLWDVNANAALSPATMLAAFSAANGTDLSYDVRLKWTGCNSTAAPYAPLDYVSFAGTEAPSNCFSDIDILPDKADPFLLHVSPIDRGVDCSLSSFSLGLVAPSNAGADSASSGAAANYTIKHSTVASGIGMILSGLSSWSASYAFLTDLILSGPSVSHTLAGVNVNKDGRFVGTQVGSTTTSYSLSSVGSWASGGTLAGQFLSLASAIAPTAANSVGAITANDTASTITGALPALVLANSFSVVAASDSALWGGSPVLVIDNGAGLSLGYVPTTTLNNMATYAGQSFITFNMPTDASYGTNPNFVKVFVVDQASGPSGIFLSAWYSATNTSKFSYGIVNITMAGPSITWAPSWTSTSDRTYDVALIKDISTNNNPMVLTVDNPTTGFLINSNTLPTYGTAGWSGQAFLPTQSVSANLTTAVGFTRCGSEFFVVGGDPSGNFKAELLQTGTAYNNLMTNTSSSIYGATPVTLSNTTAVGLATKVACAPVSGTSGRLFMTYSPTVAAPAFHAFEPSTTPVCGGALNGSIPLSGGMPTSYLPATGKGVASAFDDQFIFNSGFIVAYPAQSPQAATTIAQVGPSTCGGGGLTMSPSLNVLGGLASSQVIGFQPMHNWGILGGGVKDFFSAFGNGFYYQVHTK